MKTKLIILFLCLGVFNNVLGQVQKDELNLTPREQYDYHMLKNQENRIAGGVLLVGAAAMTASGIIINFAKCFLNDCNDGKGLALAGLGVGLSSIIFFDFAGKHNKKARVLLESGAVGFNNELKYPGILVRYSL